MNSEPRLASQNTEQKIVVRIVVAAGSAATPRQLRKKSLLAGCPSDEHSSA